MGCAPCVASCRGALLHRLPGARSRGAGEVERRADERDVRERLRKITQLPPELRRELLGEQANIVAQGKQALEEGTRILPAADQLEGVRQPEAAGEKGALAGRKPI